MFTLLSEVVKVKIRAPENTPGHCSGEKCYEGRRVFIRIAAALLNKLLAAQKEYRLSRVQKYLILSSAVNGGVHPLRPGCCSAAFFRILSECHERSSILVTTNGDFAQWTKVFGEERMTAALLDRLIHRWGVP